MNKVTRPVAVLILHKAEEYTMCIQVDLAQDFQKCSFYRELPIGQKTMHYDKCMFQLPIGGKPRLRPHNELHRRLQSYTGAAVAERLAYSVPTKAIRAQSPAGPLSDPRMWVFLGIRRSPRLPIPALPQTHLSHPHRLSIPCFTHASDHAVAIQIQYKGRLMQPINQSVHATACKVAAGREIYLLKAVVGAGRILGRGYTLQDQMDVQHVYTEMNFVIGQQFIRHSLDDCEPIADLQLNSTTLYDRLTSSIGRRLVWHVSRTIVNAERLSSQSTAKRSRRWGRGGVVVRLLAYHQGEPGSIPGDAAPEPPHVGIVPDHAVGRRVSSEISRFPPTLHSGTAPYPPHFTIIGFQDLDLIIKPLADKSVVEINPAKKSQLRNESWNSKTGGASPSLRYRPQHWNPPRIAKECSLIHLRNVATGHILGRFGLLDRNKCLIFAACGFPCPFADWPPEALQRVGDCIVRKIPYWLGLPARQVLQQPVASVRHPPVRHTLVRLPAERFATKLRTCRLADDASTRSAKSFYWHVRLNFAVGRVVPLFQSSRLESTPMYDVLVCYRLFHGKVNTFSIKPLESTPMYDVLVCYRLFTVKRRNILEVELQHGFRAAGSNREWSIAVDFTGHHNTGYNGGSIRLQGCGKRETPERNLPTSGIVRHDSHLRKSGDERAFKSAHITVNNLYTVLQGVTRNEWSNRDICKKSALASILSVETQAKVWITIQKAADFVGKENGILEYFTKDVPGDRPAESAGEVSKLWYKMGPTDYVPYL
ncbi:hypothetical protein PR048_030046 [Dryococelus australis]|uniref:C2 domain-containing protein n=1 Tax=Dryococelus australis TaxID=614101 RepID=A0ABQ9G8A9_9NEOP|nr:hypothetical protein PR048_030046 [Dryococelus australis]